MITHSMNTNDFYFDYPKELIAEQPCPERTESKLLYLPSHGKFQDKKFTDIVDLLSEDDLLVLNDTRVIAARLFGHKLSGGKVEILIERLLSQNTALAQIKASKASKAGTMIQVDSSHLRVLSRVANLFEIQLSGTDSFSDLLARCGQIPLPTYIRRKAEAVDDERYQTVYASHPGSVAAPTAGLHFDMKLLGKLRSKGVQVETLTLHVGAGTFQPIRSERLTDHRMHRERVIVGEALCQAVDQCRQRGGRVIAVGSTVLRSLETATDENGKLQVFDGETDLFIYPGYRFKMVDALVTNFHLPESTLFVLVCAFAKKQRMFSAYQHAIEQRYRLFSYGDAMYLEKNSAV